MTVSAGSKGLKHLRNSKKAKKDDFIRKTLDEIQLKKTFKQLVEDPSATENAFSIATTTTVVDDFSISSLSTEIDDEPFLFRVTLEKLPLIHMGMIVNATMTTNFAGNNSKVSQLSLSKDGCYLAFTKDLELEIWNLTTLSCTIKKLFKVPITSLAFHKHNLFVGFSNGYIASIVGKNGESVPICKAEGGEAVFAIAVIPSGSAFFFVTTKEQLYYYELEQSEMKSCGDRMQTIDTVSVYEDHNQILVVTTSLDHYVNLYNLDGKLQSTINPNFDPDLSFYMGKTFIFKTYEGLWIGYKKDDGHGNEMVVYDMASSLVHRFNMYNATNAIYRSNHFVFFEDTKMYFENRSTKTSNAIDCLPSKPVVFVTSGDRLVAGLDDGNVAIFQFDIIGDSMWAIAKDNNFVNMKFKFI